VAITAPAGTRRDDVRDRPMTPSSIAANFPHT
jgi:hypothetical protein